MSLNKLSRNKRSDAVLKLFEAVARRVESPDWSVHAHQSSYSKLLAGDNDNAKLTTYSLLKPSILDQFASATIASACFEDTMLYRLWTAQGTVMKPVGKWLRGDLRYDRHQNGNLITIHYVLEDDWSKALRDKKVEVNKTSVRFREHLIEVIGDFMADEAFGWMANIDIKDLAFAHKANAQRLPNSPHGLNCYQHLHNVVVLSALNPPPTHFSFMDSQGVNGDEVRTANYRLAVYQAVMRISIRDPHDMTPKRVVVMDRTTADWLSDLFPGAKVERLPGVAVDLRKGKAGRKTLHASNAQKTRYYREQKAKHWLAELDAINGTSVIAGPYPDFAAHVRGEMAELIGISNPNPCDENTFSTDNTSHQFGLTSGSAFRSIYDTSEVLHLDLDSDEEFVRLLRVLHERQVTSKDDNLVFSPAHFDIEMSGAETRRGLANIRHLRGIWLDNDGGDLTHNEFARLFPYLRVVVWNTYSSTKDQPRWRAFIPTTYAMSIEVHGLILKQIEKGLNKGGYWGKRQLEKKKSIKSRLCHGFDESKFNAASMFYMPCQAADPKESFFKDYNEPTRGSLDIHDWIENCVLNLRPDPEPARAVASTGAASAVASSPTSTRVATPLETLRKALAEQRAQSSQGRREAMIEKALEDWRAVLPHDGHDGFFRLAAALKRAGLDDGEIRQKLSEAARYANTPSERRAEIKGIMRSLNRIGRF